MKVLVCGSGGREHALVWKLAQSPRVEKIFCAPGNPGIARYASLVPVKADDRNGLLAFVEREGIDLTVVGPEQPLAEGIVDQFRSRGKRIFGPSRAAAELEWSKAFAKDFMERHGIPTAAHRTFDSADLASARAYIKGSSLPVVLKADGLAAGKGVLICATRDEALSALHDLAEARVFGDAGSRVVVEEYMTGQEASVFAVADGENFVTLAPAQDHKRVFDGDRGKNTGGMGAYAPAEIVTPDLLRRVEEEVIRPTLRGMASEGRPYAGCLYVGLMLTPQGPRVVEYNARFGDPETQVVLPLYGGDLAELLVASCDGKIASGVSLPPVAGSAVCVVLASGGYPDAYRTGLAIDGIDAAGAMPGVVVFHAGTKREGDALVTAGGRVLGVTALHGGGIREALSLAYSAVERIRFDGMHYRRDVGRKALEQFGRSL
jgi:phosphoribosylamine--glycine ligase